MTVVLRSESEWSGDLSESEMMEVRGKTSRNLSVRPSYVDAFVAYNQVNKGKARGKKKTLWLRLVMQKYLFQLGNFVQVHCGKIVFVGLVALCMSCLGLKTYQVEGDVKKLWVDVGGRLTRETKYTEDALGADGGELNELIIQVAEEEEEEEGGNVLSVESLLFHLEVLKVVKATHVEVLGVNWTIRELCHMLHFSYFEEGHTFNKIMENLWPCVIISPLECFWEGGKLAGPEKPANIPNYGDVTWSDLNPQRLLNEMSPLSPTAAAGVKEILDKAGVTTGYLEKPCLDPHDPGCPETAPNFYSKEPPDVATVLSHGCDGLATKFLHWPEDLILGGIERNRSGHIVRARALQSIVVVMGEKFLYDIYAGMWLTWNESIAEMVIKTWEKQMAKELDRFTSEHGARKERAGQRTKRPASRDKVFSFTSSSMGQLLEDFGRVSYTRVALGFLLMACYAVLGAMNVKKCDESQAAVAAAGLFLLVLSSAAGFGLCSVLQLTFNAFTTQVAPFLVVGLGMDQVFLVLHTFTQLSADGIPFKMRTGACMKRVGGLLLTSTVCCSSAFLLASVIPVPVTRFFCLQCCLLTLVNGTSTMFVFPAMVSIDLLRRKSGRMDFFCCQFRPTQQQQLKPREARISYKQSKNSPRSFAKGHRGGGGGGGWTSSSDDFEEFSSFTSKSDVQSELRRSGEGLSSSSSSSSSSSPSSSLSLSSGVTFLKPGDRSRKSSGFSSLASSQELCGATSSSSSSSSSSPSPSLSSVYFPTSEYQAPAPSGHPENPESGRKKKFCPLSMDCVLLEFVKRFYGPFLEKLPVKIIVIICFVISIIIGVVGVLRVREGPNMADVAPMAAPEREFLRIQSKHFGFYNLYVATQDNFDYASERGQQLLHSWHHSFESVNNIIRSKDGSFPTFWLETFRKWLLDVQDAFDADLKNGAILRENWRSNASTLGRLGFKLMIQTGMKTMPIDYNRVKTGRLVRNGIIYSPAFYNYLSAWVHNDIIAYDFSQANIKPNPKQWSHEKNDADVNIPASHPITFAQSAFMLNGLQDFQTTINVLTDIRNICDAFVLQGLPNYPHGLVVTFWEQYFSVRFYLLILLVSILAVVFVVVLTILLNPFAAFLEVFILACTMVELYGFIGLAAIKMSALVAITLIIAIGVTVHATVPFVLAFQTCIGPRDRRMVLSLEQVVVPSTHSFLAVFLALLVLSTTELAFVRSYVFAPFVVMLLLGWFNGLVFFPVLLSLVGPLAEVTPLNDELYFPPPSPVIRPQTITSSRSRSGQKASYKTRKKSRSLGGRSSRSRSRITTRLKNPPNLSTIVEESSNNSCASSISIDLKPTIIISNPSHCCIAAPASQSSSFSGKPVTPADSTNGKPPAEVGRQLQHSATSHCLHSSVGSSSITSTPVQITSCSSAHCFTTVEATTKVKVHIHDQKDRPSMYKAHPKQKNSARRDQFSMGQESERHKRTRQN